MRLVGLIGRIALLSGFGVPSLAAEKEMSWPDLPITGFISGRAATVADAEAGNAVFSRSRQSRGALAVGIPQYVFWLDERGREHPMVLVQAEKAPDGTEIIGLRDFEGGETVATMSEIRLLGPKKPE